MSKVMTKKEFMALSPAARGQAAKRSQRKRVPRAQRKPRGNMPKKGLMLPGPARNGSGRRRGQRRQRGSPTTAGNTRSFIVPVDEDIATLNGTVAFGATSFSINPGNPLMFPFFSRTAQNYERYEFEELTFHFNPSVGPFAANGVQGFVSIAATMDPLQAPPSTQSQADVLFHSPVVETANKVSLSVPKSFLQSKSLREKFLVRQNGNLPGGTDPHAYDCGQIFFCTNLQVNGTGIGLARVTGRCRLSNPANDIAGAALPNFSVSLFSVTNQVLTTAVQTLVTYTTANFNNTGIIQDGTFSIFTLPAGNFLVDVTADMDQSGTLTTGCTFLTNMMVNGAAVGPVISGTCPNSATNTQTMHIPVSNNWFVRSNGSTTVSFRVQANFTAGTADVDSMIRFTTV